jgi:hypothetical protein
MGYLMDLDEYSDEQLKEELERRRKLAKKGLCTYCGRSVDAPTCRFPERHSEKAERSVPVIGFGDTTYELTQALCEGAIAFYNDVPWNTGNPYSPEDDRHEEWSTGHALASGDEQEGGRLPRSRAEKALKEAKARKL